MRVLSLGLLGLHGFIAGTLAQGESNSSTNAIPQTNAVNTTFADVRENVAKQYEAEGPTPKEKYFRESSFHYHYDGRFANSTLPNEQVTPHLSALIQTYLETMRSIGAETWIMHGTLLAWWWNQKIFPWDNDLDVQISEPTIHFLADYYNFTDHHYDIPDVDGGRTYLLEINPNYVVKTTADRLNVIDGRWIDKSSGLFIDITAVRPDDSKRASGHPEALMCKDKHHYEESEIFPLRDSYFEEVPVKIPYNYAGLLREEYGSKSMTNTDFSGHHFDTQTKIWDKVKRATKQFFDGRSNIPVRAKGTEPSIHMSAV